jgi:hypothetical protein
VDEGGSVDEVSLSLSEEAPWGTWGGSLVTGDPGGYVKKVSGCVHPSLWGPLCRRETRDPERGLVYRGSREMNKGRL